MLTGAKEWLSSFWKVVSNKEGIAFLMVSGTVSIVVDRGFKAYDDYNSKRDQTRAQFRTEANSFDTLVGFYVQSIVEKSKVDQDALNKLSSNLIAQQQDANALLAISSGRDSKQIEEYISALGAMHVALINATDVLHMSDFWKQASRIITIRNNVLKSLKT